MPSAAPARDIDALVFDLDGTLYHHPPVRRGMTLRLLGYLIRQPLAGRRTLRVISAYRRAQETLRSSGRSGAADQLAEACRRTGADAAWAATVVREWMEQAPLDLVRRYMRADLPGFLDRARTQGIRLAVFSDYPPDAKLAAMGVREYFQHVCCAQDQAVGVFKPDPRGLLVTLDALGVHPARAVYVGDRLDVDERAASAAGMRAAIIGASAPAATPTCLHAASFTELADRLGL